MGWRSAAWGLVMAACAASDADTGAALDDATLAQADALLAAAADHRAWPQPGGADPVPSTAGGAHGVSVAVWWSPDAHAALEAGEPLPEGAILVKESYDDPDGHDLIAVTYTWKQGGRFYLATGPAGAVVAAGYEIEPCTSCHEGAPDGVLSEMWQAAGD